MPPPTLFADTFFWVALLSPRDRHHSAAMAFSSQPSTTRFVTTDLVLVEVLNHFCGMGPTWRGKAAAQVRGIRLRPDIDVLTTTDSEFVAALAFYESRPDKGYSLTDCRSMLAMRGLGITEALTNDRHFTQEGFTILFPGQ
jgi:predicted nucleic acid-binding protein